MNKKPKVALLMTPGLENTLFNDESRKKLGKYCEVISWIPSQKARLDSDILLTSWGCPKFDHEFLGAMPSLKMIGYAAGTIKKLVSDEFWSRDIKITSSAAANAIAVAEYTVSTMVFLAKNIKHAAKLYTNDNKDNFLKLRDSPVGFNNLNVGLIGASHVGREVIRLLKSYNVKVAVYDPYLTHEEAKNLGVEKMELNELMSWSDVLSIHAPKLSETENMIGYEQLSLMKDGSFLVNTARGAIVDYEALVDITPKKKIEVVIDVTDPDEPLPESSPLRKLNNVFITPHIAGSRGNEQQLMGTLAVEEIIRYVTGEPLRYQAQKNDLSRIA
ncbi:MAG: hydroxyacid dehydrogenase [Candidatus Saccharimonadales bacterium]